MGVNSLQKTTRYIIPLLTDESVENHGDKSDNNAPNVGCEQCIHKRKCIANDMSYELLTQFDHHIVHKKPLRKGRHLYWQNSPFKGVHIIHSGAVMAYRVSPNGVEQVVGFYYPGDVVGIDGLFNGRHVNSLVTLDVTTACELPFLSMSDLLTKSEPFQKRLLSVLGKKLNDEQDYHTLVKRSVDERLAGFLIDLSLKHQNRYFSPSNFNLHMKRKDIANYLGLAVETVSRILTRFQERGWISITKNQVTITDRQALEGLVAEC
jgi:CRP/FNR family transcriptional regulator